MLEEAKVTNYGIHSLKNMMWREIFYSRKLGNENAEVSNELLWNYIDIVKESAQKEEMDLSETFNTMEDKLFELETLWKKEEDKRKKQGEISSKIEKLWKDREKNNEELSRYYKLRELLEFEEEEKLEQEWSLNTKSLSEINQRMEENIEKRKQLETRKEEVNLELKRLRNIQKDIWNKKEEYFTRFDEYSYELDKLNSKLSTLCSKLKKDCEEEERTLNLMLIEFSGKIQEKTEQNQNFRRKS